MVEKAKHSNEEIKLAFLVFIFLIGVPLIVATLVYMTLKPSKSFQVSLMKELIEKIRTNDTSNLEDYLALDTIAGLEGDEMSAETRHSMLEGFKAKFFTKSMRKRLEEDYELAYKGEENGKASVDLVFDKSGTIIKFVLVKEGDKWRILGHPIKDVFIGSQRK